MANINFITVPSKRLATSIDSSATEIELNNVEGWDGEDVQSSDFGSKGYGVLRDDSNSRLELFEFDPSSLPSTTLQLNKRGLQFDGNTTNEVGDNKLNWIQGETIVELGSNPPQIFQWLKEYVDGEISSVNTDLSNNYANLSDNETITGQYTFDLLPESDGDDPTDDNDLARKKWIDDTFANKSIAETISGTWDFSTLPTLQNAPTSDNQAARKGYVDAQTTGATASNARVVTPGIAGESVSAGDLLYRDDGDNEWKKVDADTASTYEDVEVGIAQGSGTDGNSITDGVLRYGLDTNQSGLTEGTTYYASSTAGNISTSSSELQVGVAHGSTNLFFAPVTWILSDDVIDEASRDTGTPSNDAGKVVGLDPDGYISPEFLQGNLIQDVNTKYFTTTGSNTWSKPSDLAFVIVEVQGGGGTPTTFEHVGGGAGGYAKRKIDEGSLSSSETVTVGTTGNDSSFGSFCTGNGATESSGGNSTGGDINIPGGDGNRESQSGDNVIGGDGADSMFGFGGQGGNASNQSSGGNGKGYGAGGGGNGENSSGAGSVGSGAQGIVIVKEFLKVT